MTGIRKRASRPDDSVSPACTTATNAAASSGSQSAPSLSAARFKRCGVHETDHRHRRLLPSGALHLGRKQKSAATDQCNELTPLHVEHGGLPPRCVAPPTGPCAQSFAPSSLPQGGPQVLGANLKCSESEACGGLPLNVPDQDSTWRWGRRRGLPKPREIMSGHRDQGPECWRRLAQCRSPRATKNIKSVPTTRIQPDRGVEEVDCGSPVSDVLGVPKIPN